MSLNLSVGESGRESCPSTRSRRAALTRPSATPPSPTPAAHNPTRIVKRAWQVLFPGHSLLRLSLRTLSRSLPTRFVRSPSRRRTVADQGSSGDRPARPLLLGPLARPARKLALPLLRGSWRAGGAQPVEPCLRERTALKKVQWSLGPTLRRLVELAGDRRGGVAWEEVSGGRGVRRGRTCWQRLVAIH